MPAVGTAVQQGQVAAIHADIHHGAAIDPGKNLHMLRPRRDSVVVRPGPAIWQFENRGKLLPLIKVYIPVPLRYRKV